MTRAEQEQLLLGIKDVAAADLTPVKTRLNSIRSLIENHLCSRCGVVWKRGGNRQGSALCEICYNDPTL